MRGGLRRAHLALVLLGTAACTQEIALPISPLVSADEPDAGSHPRHLDGPPGVVPDVAASDDVPGDDGDADAANDGPMVPDPMSCRPLDHPIRQYHPKLILALDRSASMYRKPAGGKEAPIQWVQDGLRSLMETYEGTIYFGYEEFPISPKAPECGETCCASVVVQPPSEAPLASISQRWSCTDQPAWCKETFSESPSYEALGRIAEYYDTLIEDLPGPRYALLMTDHEPWCPGVATAKACQRTIDQTAALKRGFPSVRTLVFGLSDLVSGSLCLSEVAHHGGLARDPNKFPSHFVTLTGADFTKQLGEQLAAIARDACTFSLEQYIAGGRTLGISIDGRPIPRDEMNGWDWISDYRFRLNGTACDQLVASSTVAIDVQQCRK
jgi:hypothetical protein